MNNVVRALGIYNLELYAGGDFITADGSPANHIAKWNGTSWSTLGTGTDTTVWSLAVYNSDLYVGGEFQNAGGNPAKYIAKWNTPVGIKENFTNDEVNIYPNPANTIMNLELGIKNAAPIAITIRITDMLGNILKQENITTEKISIDVSDIQNGIYFVCVKTLEGVQIKKIVVQH